MHVRELQIFWSKINVKNIGIVGHFGFGQELANGQTVKTKTLSKGLQKYSDNNILEVDTYGWNKHPLHLLKNIKSVFINCDTVIMLPAHNGVKIFAPLFAYFKKKYKKKIVYDVIGGWLPEYITANPKILKNLMQFDGIWVETQLMKSKLLDMGLENVVVVPNFKELKAIDISEFVDYVNPPFRLCTFSRISKEKGIEDAVNAVKHINNKHGSIIYELDIYGYPDADYQKRFQELQQDFPKYIRYIGCIDSNKSTDVLKNYFALLFPTFYEGEGFAGTLIDAYSAGLPVIATDWKYNSEIVNDKTGFIYPTYDIDSLCNILEAVAKDTTMLTCKKEYCISEAKKYEIQSVIKTLIEQDLI